ncbi:endonuclease VII [Gordonia phage Kabocha]|uniref:Endonuclease VII n=1 Tax=Gordonia phage Chidiebere TaxID=2656530 RepID=A0A649VKN0_9CAUD|nr:endonuclease VII [Gordonia phage Chidiebere]AZS07974.1 endonuclease VII [Gordonia phage Gray]QGJ92956.1 endonuclease VII [Gordonia phage Chidiebere]WAA19852.1 endonuclease VII [Gordonia phage Kabocha]
MGGTWVHRLTDIDTDARTAVCANCGPVDVKVARNKSPRCMEAVRAEYLVRERPPGHRWPKQEYTPDVWRKQAYGMAAGEFDMMRKRQRNRCAICKRRRKLFVDHDHKTGKVRGLLCHHCNTGIGMLEDSPVYMRRAITYVKKHRCQGDES